MLAGGGTPLTPSIIIAACCLVSVGCLLALRETAGTDLTAEPAATPVPQRG